MTAVRTRTLTTVLCGLLWAAAGQAQLWTGPAALEVRAKDQHGGAAAGAEVKLVDLDLTPPDGPPPVKLDAHGNAVVGGLAPGRWRVEVSREGYMTWQAEIALRPDAKPAVSSTLQINVPGAVHMLDVRLGKARSSPAPAPPARGTAPDAGRARQAPASAPSGAPGAQPVAPSRPAAPAPPAPVVAVPAPPPPPPPPAAEEPIARPPRLTAPPVQPAPAPKVAPPPPAVPPAPAAPPQETVRRRSYEDRTCVECKPGESSLSVEAVVAPMNAVGCSAGVRNVAEPGTLPAGCSLLRLTLPPETRFTGYRYEVQGAESVDCQAGKDCPGGVGRFPADPQIRRSATGGVTLAALFESGPTGGEHRAVFTAYFTTGTAAKTKR